CLLAEAGSGKEFLRLVRSEPFDCILLDYMLPDDNGISLLTVFQKENPALNMPPIIFLTGYGNEEIAIQAMKIGISDYLVKKSLTPDLLNKSIHYVIQKNISDRKIQDYRQNLETLVSERTRALETSEKELKQKSLTLEETHTALKILFQEQEKSKEELHDQLLFNARQIILPYLERLEKTRLSPEQKSLVDIIRTHINDMISPFLKNLNSRHIGLSPTETRIAGLIKEGRTHKEIAQILLVSENTVLFHRSNLRKKLNLKHKKINLQEFLSSMDN
ncbi:MAG: response regulator, partial [Desulfobacula sp.]